MTMDHGAALDMGQAAASAAKALHSRLGRVSANGTKADLYTCNGTGAQRWTRDGDTLRALGTCLHVAAAGTANGTKVQALPAPHRRWTLTA